MSNAGAVTADELLHLNLPNKRTELVRGVLVVREPAGYRHGEVAARLAKVIMNYVDDEQLGHGVAAETGFKLASNPDTVRAADVAFVSRARMPDPPPRGYAEVAPDLVVEVLSPDDRPTEVLEKVREWLNAGSQLVWVVDPELRQAGVYRPDGTHTIYGEDEVLDGESVLPAFRTPVKSIF